MSQTDNKQLLDEAARLLADNPGIDNVFKAAELLRDIPKSEHTFGVALGFINCAEVMMGFVVHHDPKASPAFVQQYLLLAANAVMAPQFTASKEYGTQKIEILYADGTKTECDDVPMMHTAALEQRTKIVDYLFKLAEFTYIHAPENKKNDSLALDCLLWAHRISPKRQSGALPEVIKAQQDLLSQIAERYQTYTRDEKNTDGVSIYTALGYGDTAQEGAKTVTIIRTNAPAATQSDTVVHAAHKGQLVRA